MTQQNLPNRFTKKPVTIEAVQWFKHGDHAEVTRIPPDHPIDKHAIDPDVFGWVPTLEGGHVVTPGDWIIRGVKGELYPCKPDIFEATYAPESAALSSQGAGEAVAGKWDGAEEWMSLAWELCADECGEEACTELVWEGGPIPEPWGDRWLKYEGEAKRLIALVRKHTCPQAAQPARVVDAEQLTALIAEKLSGTYHCNRAWSAWGIGTMSEDDFSDVGESDTSSELAQEIVELLSTPPAAPTPSQAGAVTEQLIEIDYTALIHAGFVRHKYPQGTKECIAFKRGAEWFRDEALAAFNAKKGVV